MRASYSSVEPNETKEILARKTAGRQNLPKITTVAGKMSKCWGKGRMVIPAPREVDALMRRVPAGRLTTINELRSALARRHKVDLGCPITTGIFAWIAAHAAAEDAATGRKRITPYWRTLKSGGQLNEKYPGGLAELKRKLRAEGHSIVRRGKNFYVDNFERNLFVPRG